MVIEGSDPRIYLAAERTLLAWVRTGLSVIGLGFVVARFALFLRIARGSGSPQASLGSTLIGVGLVLLGVVAVGVAAWHHRLYCRELPESERPTPFALLWPVAFAWTLALIGLALAFYLIMGSNGIVTVLPVSTDVPG